MINTACLEIHEKQIFGFVMDKERNFKIITAKTEHILDYERLRCSWEKVDKPDYERILKWEKSRPKPDNELTLVAMENNKVIGFARAREIKMRTRLRKCQLNIMVDKEITGDKIDSSLYSHLLIWLKDKQFSTISFVTGEQYLAGFSFMENDGDWKEVKRRFKQTLDLNNFESDYNLIEIEEEFEKMNLELFSFEDVADEEKSDFSKQHYNLYCNTIEDETGVFGERETVKYEEWLKRFEILHLKQSLYYFLRSRKDNKLIAMTSCHFTGENLVDTGFTGVLKDYRNQKLATLLKNYITIKAMGAGAEKISTTNDSGNESILKINKKLGYLPQSDWITYEKVIEN